MRTTGRGSSPWGARWLVVLAGALAALAALSLAPGAGGQGRSSPGEGTPEGDWLVVPYYVVPADQEPIPEYEAAIGELVVQVRTWFEERVGLAFRLAPLVVARAREDYLSMRCGTDPAERERGRSDRQHMPHWLAGVERAVGGFRDRGVAWVFAQGGGGWAGGNLVGAHRGYAIFGDWVLEPISGVPNPAGIPASEATWQVEGGTPRGTTAHELGHAFGLHHPEACEGRSIMKWHGDYPDTGLLAHEVLVLRHSPFFAEDAYDAGAPRVAYETADAVRAGAPCTILGEGFRAGDVVEFLDPAGVHEVTPERVAARALELHVPGHVGPGAVRVRRGELRSNAVAVNVLP